MAFVSSLVLFCLCCFAADVVELDPVQSNNFECNSLGITGTACNANPYCHLPTSGTIACIDDPCLHVVAAGTAKCDIVDNVPCEPFTVATNHDCVEGSGTFCRSPSAVTANYDYCFWANLRDGGSNCPSSICRIENKKCVPSINPTPTQCNLLSESDCALVPKCLWVGGGLTGTGSCQADPCFPGSKGQPCAAWLGNGGKTKPLVSTALASGDCKLYQPYLADGTVESYCVYAEYNKNPNLCYFLGGNFSDSDTDWGKTYPTYNMSAGSTTNPKCTGTISGCDSNPSNACSTKINTKGALAGLYCGDLAHGAANVINVPSMVVFLLSSMLISMLA